MHIAGDLYEETVARVVVLSDAQRNTLAMTIFERAWRSVVGQGTPTVEAQDFIDKVDRVDLESVLFGTLDGMEIADPETDYEALYWQLLAQYKALTSEEL